MAERWDSIRVVSSNWDVPFAGAETGQAYTIRYVIDAQGLDDAIALEVVSIQTDKNGEEHIVGKTQLDVVSREGNLYTFEAQLQPKQAGIYKTAVRMYPKNALLPHRQDFCYVKWLD